MDLMSIPLAKYEAVRKSSSDELLPYWLSKPNPTYALPISEGLELALRTGSDYRTFWDVACTLSDLPKPLRSHVQLFYVHRLRTLTVIERHFTGDWTALATYRQKM